MPDPSRFDAIRLRALQFAGAEETARRAAERAREALSHLATGRIRLTNISGDKYFGRIVADVTAEGDTDIGAAMIGTGLARTYDGGKKVRESC